MKKRFLTLALTVTCILSACLFAGCGKSEPAAEPEVKEETVAPEVETPAEPAPSEEPAAEESEEAVGMVNPLKSVTKEELFEETGISFVDEYITTDPEYFVLTPADPSENKIAELRFKVGDCEFTCRGQYTDKNEAIDLTGLYYEWETEKDTKVLDWDAKYMQCAEATGMYWIDLEYSTAYSLACVGTMDESQFMGCAELLFDPSVQNQAVAPAYNYEGEYTDADEDTVIMKRNEDGTYSIEISITRLCVLEGRANDVDGAAEFVVEDPNGGSMSGIFYTNGDDTYTVMFTEADWTYIKTGDKFEGFTRR